MMGVPEEDWVNTNVRGKMPASITPSSEWQTKLAKAMAMAPGKLPPEREAHYRHLISLDDTLAAKPAVRPSVPGKAVGGAANVATPNAASTEQPKLARPVRQGAKRGYGDASFVGYGDGYGDDDGNGTDGDRRGVKKRRKESYSAATTPVTATAATASTVAGTGVH